MVKSVHPQYSVVLFNCINFSTVCHVTLTMNTWIKMGKKCFQHILHIIIKLIKILILKKKGLIKRSFVIINKKVYPDIKIKST